MCKRCFGPHSEGTIKYRLELIESLVKEYAQIVKGESPMLNHSSQEIDEQIKNHCKNIGEKVFREYMEAKRMESPHGTPIENSSGTPI